MLLHEQPVYLPLDHPAQKDIADGWDEIRRLRSELEHEMAVLAIARNALKNLSSGEWLDIEDILAKKTLEEMSRVTTQIKE